MIPYFPKAYNDEIFYSIIARYIDEFGDSGSKIWLKSIFLSSTISATLDLPSGLFNFCKQSKIFDIKLRSLLLQHTLFPYYSRFLPVERRRKILKSMLGESGDIHTRIGANAGIFPPILLPRYCPVCLREDIINFKKTYFRRTHQIPSIKICTIHNVFLEDVKNNISFLNKHYFIVANEENCKRISFPRKNHNDSVLKISLRLVELLEASNAHIFNSSPYFYKETLTELGLVKGNQSIDLVALYKAFDHYFDEETLRHFKSEISFENQSCWLKGIVRKHRKTFDPVRHVLLEDFIQNYRSTKAIKTTKASVKKPCLNPICSEYQNANFTISTEYVDRKSLRPITYTVCKCGYGYTQSFLKDKYKVFTRVKNFGPLWEGELFRMIKEGWPIRKIGRTLNCDSRTINTYRRMKESTTTVVDNTLQAKELWITLSKENPTLSIKQLRTMNPSLYARIYKKDKDWLSVQKYGKPLSSKSIRVDWVKRDQEILLKLKVALRRLKAEEPQRRINKTLLLRMINKETLFKTNKLKLPESDKFLDSVAEAIEDYRIRKIVRAFKVLKGRGSRINYSGLLRCAGIKNENVSNNIKSVIDFIIEKQSIIEVEKRVSA